MVFISWRPTANHLISISSHHGTASAAAWHHRLLPAAPVRRFIRCPSTAFCAICGRGCSYSCSCKHDWLLWRWISRTRQQAPTICRWVKIQDTCQRRASRKNFAEPAAKALLGASVESGIPPRFPIIRRALEGVKSINIFAAALRLIRKVFDKLSSQIAVQRTQAQEPKELNLRPGFPAYLSEYLWLKGFCHKHRNLVPIKDAGGRKVNGKEPAQGLNLG